VQLRVRALTVVVLAGALAAGCTTGEEGSTATDEPSAGAAADPGTGAGPDADPDGEPDPETGAATDAAPDPEPRAVDTSDLPSSVDDEPVWADELVLADRRPWPDDAFVAADEDLRVDNRDEVEHHLRAWDGSFELRIDAGEQGTLRTPEPGAYPYACLIHPELRGELDVA
jgi:hypothetical protein